MSDQRTRNHELSERLVSLYASSLASRFYVRVKLFLLPLAEIAELVPRQGRILDMGCGFGYVSNYLNLDSPERQILGNDPSEPRVATAQGTLGGRANVTFVAKDIRELAEDGFDAATVFDVLHHAPYDQQQALIDELYKKLRPGGMLVIRETDQRFAVRYFLFNWALELALYVGSERAKFRKKAVWAEMLRKPGFEIERVTPNQWWFPYMTCLFVCRKKA
jgi:2-polyprenyl-3-methyl-5-hydroxy-6-metoxy-1,4-benzoquinol methylase